MFRWYAWGRKARIAYPNKLYCSPQGRNSPLPTGSGRGEGINIFNQFYLE